VPVPEFPGQVVQVDNESGTALNLSGGLRGSILGGAVANGRLVRVVIACERLRSFGGAAEMGLAV
jgi:hypothetical protein